MSRGATASILAGLVLFASPARPTAPVEVPALDRCQSEVSRLRRENAELRKKLKELQRAERDVTSIPSEAENAALASVRALASVADTAGRADFRRYLLDAKVKVEGIPSGPTRTALAELLGMYLLLDDVWDRTRKELTLSASELIIFESAFPDIRKDLVVSCPTCTAEDLRAMGRTEQAYMLSDLGAYILKTAKARVEAFTLPTR